MAKITVQDLLVSKIDNIEKKIDKLIPVVEGLKVKAAIAGGFAGLVGTGVVSTLLAFFK